MLGKQLFQRLAGQRFIAATAKPVWAIQPERFPDVRCRKTESQQAFGVASEPPGCGKQASQCYVTARPENFQ
ncbi:hypothetical protein D3C77_582060 [compost metagenome]